MELGLCTSCVTLDNSLHFSVPISSPLKMEIIKATVS